MGKIRIHERYLSIRKKPANLKSTDLKLFAHEFEKEIPESHINIVKNVFIINQSLISLRKFSLFSSYTYFYHPGYIKILKDFLRSTIRSFRGITYIDQGIWITDNKSAVYFHWLCDALGKYYLIPDKQSSKTVLLPEKYDINWIKEYLETMGVEFVILKEGYWYKVKELVIPSYPAPSGNFNHENIKKVSSEIIKLTSKRNKVKQKKLKKIWISRETARRKVSNKDQIDKILEKHNFTNCILEDFSLKDKVELFQNAEVIAGSHGSGITNMIFMKKNTSVVDIRDPRDNVKNAFFTLASEFDLNYYYMERDVSIDQIIIDPNKLDKLLSSIK